MHLSLKATETNNSLNFPALSSFGCRHSAICSTNCSSDSATQELGDERYPKVPSPPCVDVLPSVFLCIQPSLIRCTVISGFLENSKGKRKGTPAHSRLPLCLLGQLFNDFKPPRVGIIITSRRVFHSGFSIPAQRYLGLHFLHLNTLNSLAGTLNTSALSTLLLLLLLTKLVSFSQRWKRRLCNNSSHNLMASGLLCYSCSLNAEVSAASVLTVLQSTCTCSSTVQEVCADKCCCVALLWRDSQRRCVLHSAELVADVVMTTIYSSLLKCATQAVEELQTTRIVLNAANWKL